MTTKELFQEVEHKDAPLVIRIDGYDYNIGYIKEEFLEGSDKIIVVLEPSQQLADFITLNAFRG